MTNKIEKEYSADRSFEIVIQVLNYNSEASICRMFFFYPISHSLSRSFSCTYIYMSHRSYTGRRSYNFVTLMQRSCDFDDAIYRSCNFDNLFCRSYSFHLFII